jgi:hypothetical protein
LDIIGINGQQIPKIKQNRATHSKMQAAKIQWINNETDILRMNKPTPASVVSVVKM